MPVPVELRALRQLARVYPDTPDVFVTERKGPMTDSTFRKIVARAGIKAPLGFPVHPHMLRHATGFKLAKDGQNTRTMHTTSGTRIFNTLCAILSEAPSASRRFGRIKHQTARHT